MYFWSCEYDVDDEYYEYGVRRYYTGVAESLEKAQEYIKGVSKNYDANVRQHKYSYHAVIKEISADYKRMKTVMYYDKYDSSISFNDDWRYVKGPLWAGEVEL